MSKDFDRITELFALKVLYTILWAAKYNKVLLIWIHDAFLWFKIRTTRCLHPLSSNSFSLSSSSCKNARVTNPNCFIFFYIKMLKGVRLDHIPNLSSSSHLLSSSGKRRKNFALENQLHSNQVLIIKIIKRRSVVKKCVQALYYKVCCLFSSTHTWFAPDYATRTQLTYRLLRKLNRPFYAEFARAQIAKRNPF